MKAWNYFLSCYQEKYTSPHLQNAKTMSQFSQIWKQVGGGWVYVLIDSFLGCNEYWYVKNCHQIGLLLQDLQKFFVLSKTRKKMITKKEAEEIEKQAGNSESLDRIAEINKMYDIYKAKGGDMSIVEFTMLIKKKYFS
jgi:hypothetical protein